MSFFSRFFKKKEEIPQEPCPRCMGKGHIDIADIRRLRQEANWTVGTCAYCNGDGTVEKDMLTRVPADAPYLTTDLSAAEREEMIRNNSWSSTFPLNQKREGCPVTEQSRLWLEDAFLLLIDLFGKESIQQRKVLLQDYSHFPIQYNGTEATAYETMKIVAAQMEVDAGSIELAFYDEGMSEIDSGGAMGSGRVYLEPDKTSESAAGLYWGKGEQGKYEIWLSIAQLTDPEAMVATLAHEIAHIKLLGENRIAENDESLTDLTPLVFGLGIFNANNAFKSFIGLDYHAWKSQGYLTQMQWGYALALFAYIREEQSPAWAKYLTANVKADFLQGQQFIADNKELVFR